MSNDLGGMNLAKLIQQYSDEDKCRETLKDLRWPGGVCCPRCGSLSVSVISTRDQWDCNDCRYRFSVTSGTIFDNTKIPLWKWFVACYLMIESKKGMSAAQVGRTLDVSYPTAWHLCHRIREAMDEDDDPTRPLLSGIIEVDETWIGGRQSGMGQGPYSTTNKSIVVGAKSRSGKIRLDVVADRKRNTLHAFIRRHVSDDAEAIYTDEFLSYRGIADHNTRHETVNHSEKEWVHGDVHTNGVENVWSLLKRSIVGSFHKVSVKHLERYLDELEWRFNNRDNPFMFRDLLIRLLDGEALRYRALTA
jgi:transposase-like protein